MVIDDKIKAMSDKDLERHMAKLEREQSSLLEKVKMGGSLVLFLTSVVAPPVVRLSGVDESYASLISLLAYDTMLLCGIYAGCKLFRRTEWEKRLYSLRNELYRRSLTATV